MDAPDRRRVAAALRGLGVVVLLAVLPLVSTPETLDIREPVRRVAIAAVLVCAAGAWWADRRGPQLPRAVWWAMGVVALAAVGSTWASANSWLSVVGRYPRDEGLLMIVAYLAMLPAGAVLFATAAGRRLANYLRVLTMEAQTIARACGKSHLHNLEPEDLVALTIEAAAMAQVPLAGTGWIPGQGAKF